MTDLREHHETVQRLIETLYRDSKHVARLEVILRAECWDLPEEVIGIFELLPPGHYPRHRLCDQINSAIVGHGWGRTLGTFD